MGKNFLNPRSKKNIPKPIRYNESGSKREAYSYKCLLKNSERFQINNLIMHLNVLEKQE
jgi:hypothetical protein